MALGNTNTTNTVEASRPNATATTSGTSTCGSSLLFTSTSERYAVSILDYTDANTCNRERLEMTLPLTGKDYELKKEKREHQRSIRNLKIAIYHLNAVKKRERDQATARGIDDAIDENRIAGQIRDA